MEWLCPICETINTENNKSISINDMEYHRKKKCCKTCFFKRDDGNWDTHIQMNELIDQYLPRHQLYIPLSYQLIEMIHPRKWFIKENTLDYIKYRVSFRNKLVWRNWRRNIFYRKFVERIIDKWQSTMLLQFPARLVVEYLF